MKCCWVQSLFRLSIQMLNRLCNAAMPIGSWKHKTCLYSWSEQSLQIATMGLFCQRGLQVRCGCLQQNVAACYAATAHA